METPVINAVQTVNGVAVSTSGNQNTDNNAGDFLAVITQLLGMCGENKLSEGKKNELSVQVLEQASAMLNTSPFFFSMVNNNTISNDNGGIQFIGLDSNNNAESGSMNLVDFTQLISNGSINSEIINLYVSANTVQNSFGENISSYEGPDKVMDNIEPEQEVKTIFYNDDNTVESEIINNQKTDIAQQINGKVIEPQLIEFDKQYFADSIGGQNIGVFLDVKYDSSDKKLAVSSCADNEKTSDVNTSNQDNSYIQVDNKLKNNIVNGKIIINKLKTEENTGDSPDFEINQQNANVKFCDPSESTEYTDDNTEKFIIPKNTADLYDAERSLYNVDVKFNNLSGNSEERYEDNNNIKTIVSDAIKSENEVKKDVDFKSTADTILYGKPYEVNAKMTVDTGKFHKEVTDQYNYDENDDAVKNDISQKVISVELPYEENKHDLINKLGIIQNTENNTVAAKTFTEQNVYNKGSTPDYSDKTKITQNDNFNHNNSVDNIQYANSNSTKAEINEMINIPNNNYSSALKTVNENGLKETFGIRNISQEESLIVSSGDNKSIIKNNEVQPKSYSNISDKQQINIKPELINDNSKSNNSDNRNNGGTQSEFYHSINEIKKIIKNNSKEDNSDAFEVNVDTLQKQVNQISVKNLQLNSVSEHISDKYDVTGQVINSLNENIKSDAVDLNKELTIKLSPDGLGEITVKFVKDADKIVLNLTSTNESTVKILNDRLTDLQSSLRVHNAEVSNITVQKADSSSGQMSYNNLNQSFGNGQQFSRGGRNFYDKEAWYNSSYPGDNIESENNIQLEEQIRVSNISNSMLNVYI